MAFNCTPHTDVRTFLNLLPVDAFVSGVVRIDLISQFISRKVGHNSIIMFRTF